MNLLDELRSLVSKYVTATPGLNPVINPNPTDAQCQSVKDELERLINAAAFSGQINNAQSLSYAPIRNSLLYQSIDWCAGAFLECVYLNAGNSYAALCSEYATANWVPQLASGAIDALPTPTNDWSTYTKDPATVLSRALNELKTYAGNVTSGDVAGDKKKRHALFMDALKVRPANVAFNTLETLVYTGVVLSDGTRLVTPSNGFSPGYAVDAPNFYLPFPGITGTFEDFCSRLTL